MYSNSSEAAATLIYHDLRVAIASASCEFPHGKFDCRDVSTLILIRNGSAGFGQCQRRERDEHVVSISKIDVHLFFFNQPDVDVCVRSGGFLFVCLCVSMSQAALSCFSGAFSQTTSEVINFYVIVCSLNVKLIIFSHLQMALSELASQYCDSENPARNITL